MPLDFDTARKALENLHEGTKLAQLKYADHMLMGMCRNQLAELIAKAEAAQAEQVAQAELEKLCPLTDQTKKDPPS